MAELYLHRETEDLKNERVGWGKICSISRKKFRLKYDFYELAKSFFSSYFCISYYGVPNF